MSQTVDVCVWETYHELLSGSDDVVDVADDVHECLLSGGEGLVLVGEVGHAYVAAGLVDDALHQEVVLAEHELLVLRTNVHRRRHHDGELQHHTNYITSSFIGPGQ